MSIFLSHRVPVLVTGLNLHFLPFAYNIPIFQKLNVSKIVLFTTSLLRIFYLTIQEIRSIFYYIYFSDNSISESIQSY